MTTNELALELLPCPFCGGNKARTIHIRDGRKVACICGACGKPEFHGPLDRPDAEARAIAAWNQRPQPDGDAVERACDAFMSKITVDGNGGIEFLEVGILAALAAMPAKGRDEVLEEVARLVEKRMEERFAEYGTREPDTNATYYSGRYGETLEALDEECEAITDAIRRLRAPPLCA